MKINYRRIVLLMVCIPLAAWGVKQFMRPKPLAIIDPPNESAVDLSVVEKGTTYKLYHADMYCVNPATKKWEMIEHVYDPDFYQKNYVAKDGAIFRKQDNGELIAVRKELTEDNRVEFVSDLTHSGHGAMKTYSESPSRSMICSKAHLGTELLHFVKGDDIWLSAWFRVPKGGGMPFTVLDLETTWINQHPGIRLVLWDGKHAGYELKWGRRVEYRQTKGKEIPFPLDQWVNLKTHLKLAEKDDNGLVELWQDGAQILIAHGQTLPMANTIYNSLEVGITAHNDRSQATTLYVDDVKVSSTPIR